MSRVYASLCLDDVDDLVQSPSVHVAQASDRPLSIHVDIANYGLSLWSHDPSKLRALATTLTAAADRLEAALANQTNAVAHV